MPDRPRGSGAAHQRPGRDGAAEGVTLLRGLKTPEAANVGHRTPARAGRSRVRAHARPDGANAESRPGVAPSTRRNRRCSLLAGQRDSRRAVRQRARKNGSQAAPHAEPHHSAQRTVRWAVLLLRALRLERPASEVRRAKRAGWSRTSMGMLHVVVDAGIARVELDGLVADGALVVRDLDRSAFESNIASIGIVDDTRSLPRRSRCISATAASAASRRAKAPSASSSNAAPASFRANDLVVRWRRWTPSCSATLRPTVVFGTPSAIAALRKLPACTRLTRTRAALRSSGPLSGQSVPLMVACPTPGAGSQCSLSQSPTIGAGP